VDEGRYRGKVCLYRNRKQACWRTPHEQRLASRCVSVMYRCNKVSGFFPAKVHRISSSSLMGAPTVVVEITKRGRGVEGGRGAEKYEREREREI
jgi:hypothetical protein